MKQKLKTYRVHMVAKLYKMQVFMNGKLRQLALSAASTEEFSFPDQLKAQKSCVVLATNLAKIILNCSAKL